MSNTKNSNDFGYFYIFVLLPILMMLILFNSTRTDPNSLLTDEQKLEKQKELLIEKTKKTEQDVKNAEWWNSNISYIVKEKPPIIVLVIGLGLAIALIKTGQSRGEDYFGFRYSRWFSWINSKSIFVMLFGGIYLLWLTGNFDPFSFSFNISGDK